MMVRLLMVGGLVLGALYLMSKVGGIASGQQNFAPPLVPERPQQDGWATNVTSILNALPGVINAGTNVYNSVRK